MPFPVYRTVRTHPWKTAATREPAATIYFDGLLCLFFDGANKNRCMVGVNLQPPSHELKFEIYERTEEPPCIPVRLPEDLRPGRFNEVYIRVNNSAVDGVQLYDGDPIPVPERRESYPKYCIDLESPGAHDIQLEKKTSRLWPRFHIDSGIFSASHISASTFALAKPRAVPPVEKYLGHIALAFACDIFLNPGGSIEFDSGAGRPSLKLDPGKRYEIGITNTCHGEKGCDYDHQSGDPTKRNDFHLYYDVLVVPDPFELINISAAGGGPPQLGNCIRAGWHPFSDPAPCMPLGFGRSSGL